MALYNRVKVTITAGGAGNLTIGPPLGMFQGFGDAGIPTGTLVSYVIEDANNTAWEYGRGTYTAPNTFARTTILATNTVGVTAPINASNAAVLFIDALAEDFFAGINVGATIGGGTSGRVLFDNGGALGEAANLTYDGTATSARQIKFTGATSGAVTLQAQAVAGTYSLTFPNAAPASAGQSIVSDTAGNLSWVSDAVRAFDATATYVANDIVAYQGKIYRSIAGGTTALPTDATKWTLTASDAPAAGTNRMVQYNDGGLRAGAASMLWDKAGGYLLIGTTTAPTVAGALLSVNSDAQINGLRAGKGAGTGVDCTVFGANSLGSVTTGVRNDGFGSYVLNSVSSGLENTGVGYAALNQLQTGSYNCSFGSGSMQYNKTGSQCTAVGTYALSAGVGVSGSVAIGSNSLSRSSGNNNIGIGGTSASLNETGNENVAIGGYNWSSHKNVSNHIIISDGSAAAAPNIRWQVTNQGVHTWLTGAPGASTEKMRLTSAGWLGVGTQSPSTRVHVYDTSDAALTLEGGPGAAGSLYLKSPIPEFNKIQSTNGTTVGWQIGNNGDTTAWKLYVGGTAAANLRITAFASGDVAIGAVATLTAAATSGFLRIPAIAATPTGTPAAGNTVPMAFDTATNKLWVYNAGWKSVQLT